jgi:hypothetical protein
MEAILLAGLAVTILGIFVLLLSKYEEKNNPKHSH